MGPLLKQMNTRSRNKRHLSVCMLSEQTRMENLSTPRFKPLKETRSWCFQFSVGLSRTGPSDLLCGGGLCCTEAECVKITLTLSLRPNEMGYVNFPGFFLTMQSVFSWVKYFASACIYWVCVTEAVEVPSVGEKHNLNCLDHVVREKGQGLARQKTNWSHAITDKR